MKTKSKTTASIVPIIPATILLLTAQISLAGSATWLLSPQDSAWENANNWTPGGPPNGPSDTATFAQSSQTFVAISTSEEVNSIVFTSDSASFGLSILGSGVQLIISGVGVINNNSVSQRFHAANEGQIIFNNASSAARAYMSIVNEGNQGRGYAIFNAMSSAAGASITNQAQDDFGDSPGGETIFNARRLATMPPSATKDPPNHMPVADRQFSMTHQLRPTLPSITGQAVPPVVLPVTAP